MLEVSHSLNPETYIHYPEYSMDLHMFLPGCNKLGNNMKAFHSSELYMVYSMPASYNLDRQGCNNSVWNMVCSKKVCSIGEEYSKQVWNKLPECCKLDLCNWNLVSGIHKTGWYMAEESDMRQE